MEKYAGIHKVETKVTENVHTARKKNAKGYLKTFFTQAAVALLLGAALLAGKWYGGAHGANATQKVKDAVCFDAYSYITEWIEEA
ncbi:MAG: hypothetical protein K2L51_06035 [Clostridiales bacterium]|nr:hypothetical protein [Clostridiales bacterium]